MHSTNEVKLFEKIYKYYSSKRTIVQLFFGFGLILASTLIYIGIALILNISNTNPNKYIEIGDYFYIIETILLVPLIETLVFQVLLFWLLRKINIIGIENKCVHIIIASIVFSIAHAPLVSSVLHAFLLGIPLNLVYHARVSQNRSGWWIVFILHAFRNGLGVLAMVFWN